MKPEHNFNESDRVRLATDCPGGELVIGDTGIVIAGWKRANIGIRWDKDGKLRPVHYKRLEAIS